MFVERSTEPEIARGAVRLNEAVTAISWQDLATVIGSISA